MMSENKSWKTDSSSSQTDGSALFLGQPYDSKLFVFSLFEWKFPALSFSACKLHHLNSESAMSLA